jgi:dipeptide transport system substrate-binding protein
MAAAPARRLFPLRAVLKHALLRVQAAGGILIPAAFNFVREFFMRLLTTLLAASALTVVMAGGAYAKTLVYCSEGSPEGFDPGLYESGTTLDVNIASYEGLVKFKLGTTEVQPALAEKWEISKDGLTYTFHLRHGVKWQTTDYFTPTRDFNADDVVYSFERQIKGATYLPDTTFAYWGDMSMPDQVAGIKKIDDYTVELTLKTPSAPMLANLAMPFAEIVSKEYTDKLAAAGKMAQLNDEPVGTGPFTFVNYQKDANVRFKANPDYWGGAPKVDLVFSINKDATARLQSLLAGECDVMAYPSPADVASIKKNPNLQAIQEKGLNFGALWYNTQQKPFDNVEVRKALDMALDKKAMIAAVYQGQGQVASSVLPPTMWSSTDATTKPSVYDPAAAKKLLDKAGVKDLTIKIWAMPVARPYMPDAKRAAEMMQADFAKIGVKATVYSVDWAEYLKTSKPVDRDGAVIMGWTGDNGDPDNFFTPNFGCDAVGGGNRAQWCNKDFDALLKKAQQITDQKARAKLYEQAQAIFHKETPVSLIAHSVVTMPMSKKVTGYVIDPFGLHHFETVDKSE